MSTVAEPPEDVSLAAHPYRPVARLGLTVVGAAGVLVGLWFALSTVARHRLDRAVDAVRRRGEPTAAADFPNPPVADADNAAVAWRAAMAAVSGTVDCPASSNLNYRAYPPFPPAWWTAARASEAANTAVFPLADQAAGLPVARWPPGPTAYSAHAFSAVPFNQTRGLANVLGDSALLAHFTGHDDVAVARLGDLFRLADAIDQQPSVIARLVSDGIIALAVDRVAVIAPDLDVGRPASDRRRRVAALVATLLTDPSLGRELAPLWAEQVDVLSNAGQSRAADPVLGPLADLTAVRSLACVSVDLQAAHQPDAAASDAVYRHDPTEQAERASSRLTSPGGPPAPPLRFSRFYDYSGAQRLDRYTLIGWQVEAERHAAAVALAVRLYRADHDRRWPTELSALVPAYLPAVPADPLAAGRPPVGYVMRSLPGGGDRPLLFVGLRGSDLATAPLPATPSSGVDGSRPLDWLDLARWDPNASPPTTVPAAP